jgi:hypothetical protein
MLFGQLVAVSVASNLFYLALIQSQNRDESEANRRRPRPFAPYNRLCICVLLCMVSIGISPLTTDQTFLPNLIVMHALLVIALIPFGDEAPGKTTLLMDLPTLYTFVMFLAAVMRQRTAVSVVSAIPSADHSPLGIFRSPVEFVRSVLGALTSHPAQSSMAWDLVWTTVSFFLWTVIWEGKGRVWGQTAGMVVVTAFGSVGVSAPLVLRTGITGIENEADVKEE